MGVLVEMVEYKMWEDLVVVCHLVKVEVLCYILYRLFGICKVSIAEIRFSELEQCRKTSMKVP